MSINFSYDIITSASAINQQLIRRLIDFNFKDVERYPTFRWNAVASPQFITFAQGIEAMVRAGMRVPMAWAHEIANIPIALDGEEVLEPSMSSYPGADPVAGIDNRALNADHSPTEMFASTNRIARQQLDLNESIIYRGTRDLINRWEKFCTKIATNRKFDAEILAEFEEKELSGVYSQFMLISALRGVSSARNEIQPGAYSDVSATDHFTYYYKPFDEMLKDFKRRKVVSNQEYQMMEEAARRAAFKVARQDSVRVLTKIKGDLEAVLRGADTLPDFYDQVVGLFESAGFLGKGNHIETVLRTNLQTQYTDARMKVFTQLNAEDFPYLTVEVVDDDATRRHHMALQGYTRRVNDPVWQWLKPPFEYNCRCTVRAVHASEQAEESLWQPDKNDYEFTRGR